MTDRQTDILTPANNKHRDNTWRQTVKTAFAQAPLYLYMKSLENKYSGIISNKIFAYFQNKRHLFKRIIWPTKKIPYKHQGLSTPVPTT